MRILFVPAHERGTRSHGIPLLTLSKMLDKRFTYTFLVPDKAKPFFAFHNAPVLDIDHSNLSTQTKAHYRFKPDVVVDDFSVTTALARQLINFRRITLQRTGFFPDYLPRSSDTIHTASSDLTSLSQITTLDIPAPTSFSDLLKSDQVIIPGIRTVEILPPHLKNSPKYNYSGPLLEDASVAPTPIDSNDHRKLGQFLMKNSVRPIVVITFGLITRHPDLADWIMHYLLEKKIAVVSTIMNTSANSKYPELFYYAAYISLHMTCKHANLMIHHCGSGTYNYQLAYRIPGITIPTGCYDRTDVALRLQELGASIHLENASDRETVIKHLNAVIPEMLNPTSPLAERMAESLNSLHQELTLTASQFNFPRLLLE